MAEAYCNETRDSQNNVVMDDAIELLSSMVSFCFSEDKYGKLYDIGTSCREVEYINQENKDFV